MQLSAITEYLVRTLAPDAIILHGSRARGLARDGSDWDFILLYESETPHKSDRATVNDNNIEYTIVTLPVTNIWESFGIKLSHAKVITEKNGIGSELLNRAEKYYADGVHWSEAKTDAHKLWFEGRIEGMAHYTNHPEMFYKYFSDLYSRITNYWYWIKKHKHSEPVYIALKEIEGEDAHYFELVKKLTDPMTTLAQKVEVSKAVRDHLFEPNS